MKQIIIYGLILENIEASIVHNLDAPLLLGLNAISKLGKVVIEDDKLIIYSKNKPQEETPDNLIDPTFYTDVQRVFILLFQSLKTKDSKTFIEKSRHLFANSDTTYIQRYNALTKRLERTIDTEPVDNRLKDDFDRLFSFGIKHNLNWANIKDTGVKFSVYNSDVIITFRHNNDFYVMQSFFHFSSSNSKNTILFPYEFTSINVYQYKKGLKNLYEDYDAERINQTEWSNKIIQYAEREYPYLSKKDIEYLDKWDKLEGVYEYSALMNFRNENYIRAVQDLTKVIGLTSGRYSTAFFLRGRSKLNIGDYRSAITDFDKYIALEPKVPFKNVYLYRANAKFNLENYKEALEDYNKAIQVNSNDYDAYYNRGLIKFFQLKNKKGGCSDWSKAGELGLEKAYELINQNCH